MFTSKELDKLITSWSADGKPLEGVLQPDCESLSEEDCNGKLAVIDGEVRLKRPVNNGSWPVLVPTDKVRVKHNNDLKCHPFVVEDVSELQIEVINKTPTSEFTLHVSPDKMEVVMEARFTSGAEYQLCDTEFAQHLTLKTELSREIYPNFIDEQLVLDRLRTLGIKGEILHQRIAEACRRLWDCEVVIARGKPLVPPVEGELELLCDLESRAVVANQQDKKVDYRQKNVINSVQAGDVLAKWKPCQYGKPGFNVYGEQINPPLPKRTELKVGAGVKLVDGGRIAVAEIDGRPTMERGRLCVKPQLVISGDVDMDTGNIEFTGDVIILGNVCESLTVRAGGAIDVKGSVFHATLSSGGSITIGKNLIGGSVSAGGEQAVLTRLVSLIDEICPDLAKLEQAFEQLKNHPSFSVKDLKVRGDGYLIKLILELRLQNVPRLFGEVRKVLPQLDKEESFPHIAEILTGMSKLFMDAGPLAIRSIRDIRDYLDCLLEIREKLQAHVGEPADVRVYYCQKTKVESTGSIKVTGPLVYDCQMVAGDTIEMAGACRSGSYTAKNWIRIQTVGSRGNSKTQLSVGEGGWIGAGQFHQDVQLRVGPSKMVTQDAYRNSKMTTSDGKWIRSLLA